MSDLGRAATARRLYLHVLSGGNLTSDDVSRMVQAIEELEAEVARLNRERPTAAQMAEVLARAAAAEAKLATARDDALEEAAKSLDAEADKCDDAIKWNVSARYKKDCEAASYAMRNMATAIRALKSTTQP